MTSDDEKKIGMDLAMVQVGCPVGMPVCRPPGNELWEVRSDSRTFFVHGQRIDVVDVFIKKTQKTPQNDLEPARKRLKEMEA